MQNDSYGFPIWGPTLRSYFSTGVFESKKKPLPGTATKTTPDVRKGVFPKGYSGFSLDFHTETYFLLYFRAPCSVPLKVPPNE